MDDAHAQESLGHFLGHHRGAVISQQSARQAPFLDRLGESMHQVLGSLREIPLDVVAQSRVIIEDAQRDRPQPLAAGSEHLERAVMEVEVPERSDVGGFVAADLPCLPSRFRACRARTSAGPEPGPTHQAVSLHGTLDRGIGGEPPQ